MLLTDFTQPEDTITGKTGIKLKVKGVNTQLEQFVLNPKQMYNNLPLKAQTSERLELANIEHFARLARCCIKGLEGVAIEIKGETKDINEILEWDDMGIMTNESYTIVMRVLNQDPSIVEELAKFYLKSVDLSKFITTLKKK